MKDLVAVVDLDVLQNKVNEAAQKGAESVINDFYNSYNSPYKKALEEQLKNRKFSANFELPDIIAEINMKIATEIDSIANQAVAKSFIPLVKSFLTNAPKAMKLSELLKEFIEYTDFSYNDHLEAHDYEYSIKDDYENEPDSVLFGSWFTIIIGNGEKEFQLRFYKSDKKSDTFYIPTIPKDYKSKGLDRTMKISMDGGATLELPFTPNVLQDNFTSYVARLVMAKTQITLDVECFHDEMFPERGHCHC